MFFKYHLPPLLWAAVILLLTLLPAANMPEVPEWELISFHTASHAVVFFILAVLLLRCFSKITSHIFFSQNSGLAVLVLSVAFGATIEWLQTTMQLGRQGDFMDIISNSIGTLLGLLFYYSFRRNKYLIPFL